MKLSDLKGFHAEGEAKMTEGLRDDPEISVIEIVVWPEGLLVSCNAEVREDRYKRAGILQAALHTTTATDFPTANHESSAKAALLAAILGAAGIPGVQMEGIPEDDHGPEQAGEDHDHQHGEHTEL